MHAQTSIGDGVGQRCHAPGIAERKEVADSNREASAPESLMAASPAKGRGAAKDAMIPADSTNEDKGTTASVARGAIQLMRLKSRASRGSIHSWTERVVRTVPPIASPATPRHRKAKNRMRAPAGGNASASCSAKISHLQRRLRPRRCQISGCRNSRFDFIE